VGRRLVPRLERAGFAVEAHDLDLDVRDTAALETVLARTKPGLLVHLAAIASVPESRRAPERTFEVNYLGTHSVLEAVARACPEARVLLACSADPYGSSAPGAAPFSEASPLRPRSPYARTKAAADLLGGVYAARGLSVVRARAFNHTGPGQSDAFVLASFARQAAEIAAGRREAVLRVGNLDSVRDFLDVEDVLDAYLALADPGVAPGPYNVASGHGVRVGDALDAILRLCGIAPRIRVEASRVRPTDHAVGDAARLRAATGWRPQAPFQETLARLVADWRERVSDA